MTPTEGTMKLAVITLGLFLTAWPTFGQQSTTDTNCMVNGQMVNCTSTTTNPTPPSGGWLTGINKAMAANREKAEANRNQNAGQQTPQLSPEAIKELLAEEKKERDDKDTVDFIYCRQNPKGNITDSKGQSRTCIDLIEYTKAFCSVNPEAERCALAKSKAEVEKAFAALVDEYNANTHRGRGWEQAYFGEKFARLTKWGCMSFPDMTLPQRDATSHPCPNAPEPTPLHADAGSQNR
jgi:sarcosine oxidase delta subunit